VLQVIAPDGYSGKIGLIIAIHSDGRIGGVRVISDKETPGLGDYIEIAKSKWITGFDGKSLDNPQDSDWKVRKDGGSFDYMAGCNDLAARGGESGAQGFAIFRAASRRIV